MFTEGLDPHALQWVRQQSMDTHRGRGLGIPPPEKFRSGHLPRGVIPPSRTMPLEEHGESGSEDMDESSDTEEEVYVGRYSLGSSPEDNVTRRNVLSEASAASVGNGRGGRYGVPLSGWQQHNYSSSDGYSEFSSSRETGRQQNQRSQGVVNGYTEEEEEEVESSDSGRSSGFTQKAGRSNGAGVYSRNVPYGGDVKAPSVKEDCVSDVPSAPPFHGNHEEISEVADRIPSTKACGAPCTVGPNVYYAKKKSSPQTIPGNSMPKQNLSSVKSSSFGGEAVASSGSLPRRLPIFHASGQGPWHSVIAYDACVRLCLHSWAGGCMEAPIFLENECALLRNAFVLQQVLLQSEEELLAKKSSELVSEAAAVKLKKTIGKMKVQVRKVRMAVDMPSGCNYLSLKAPVVKLESLRYRMSSLQSTLSSGWESLRKVHVLPRLPANSSFSRHSLAYMQASTQYIKQVSGLLKVGVTTLRNSSSYEVVQESYSCLLRLKSSTEEDGVRMQAGSGETHLFFPDSLGDDLIVEIFDSKGISHGRVIAQVASIAEDHSDKVRWWSIYREPEHELVGRLQLYINYTTSPDDSSALKCGSVAETVAYDLVLEVAMKVQHFGQRNLLLHGSWKWLLTEFASYYGVSDAYTKLRYLSYVMDVATPTADCLMLVHDLLLPVVLKSRSKGALSHQENRILGEIQEQIDLILATVFENYKSMDESLPSGIVEVFRPATGTPAPALAPAVKLYTLLHDILAPEAQLKLCSYIQVAAKKRSRRHLLETDEFVVNNNEGILMDVVTISTAYQKMKNLCLNIRSEIFTDIQIHDQHVLPSFVDLPNICASIYSVELCNRLRSFLVACPPTGPSQHVAELVIATADFQKDLASWNICPIKGGVDAKELFHLYIILWIQDKRLSLLESCKLDKFLVNDELEVLSFNTLLAGCQAQDLKTIDASHIYVHPLVLPLNHQVKWSGVRTQHLTTPFVDDMYDRLKETLNEYEVIICRWPEYIFVLENAIADIEKAVIEALERQYADVLAPLKDSMAPKKFGFKYVQKLTKRNSVCPYSVPDELGVLLNTLKRLIDVLRPKIELQFKSWGSCIPDGGHGVAGEHLGEVTVTLRAKFRNYLQAVVEKLGENTRAQNATKLKKIIQDSKDVMAEADIRNRMQPLKDQLMQAINHLHTVFEVHVFVAICRLFWDRMGQDVLHFLENRKENRSWYKGSRVTLAVLDDTFASQMQQLLGNSLQDKDLEPPRSIMEVRSVLCKDAPSNKDSKFYY